MQHSLQNATFLTKILSEKPLLRQIEEGLQNELIPDNRVLSLTLNIFESLVRV